MEYKKERENEVSCNTRDCEFFSLKAEQNCNGLNQCGNPAIEDCTQYTPDGFWSSMARFRAVLPESMEKKLGDDLKMMVKIPYTNYKSELCIRFIVPMKMYFGSNEWHTEKQWLLKAYDLEKLAIRTFAMKDIHYWDSK